MRKLRNICRTMGCIVLGLMMLALAGCGSDTETSQQTSTKTTSTGTVTADASGVVSESTAVSSPLGNTLTIQANTLLTTDAAGKTPVTGPIATTVSYSTNEADLPASAMTLPDGASLAAFLDIDLSAVKYFTKPLKVTMNVISGGANVGDIVAFYTFNVGTNQWEPVDNATVAADGTAPLSIRHLSIFAAFKTETPPPGKPSGSSATAGNEKVTVSWSAPQTGPAPESYNIYYAEEPGVTKTTSIKIEDVVSPYEVTGLVNGMPYYFAVSAVNDNGEGGLSSEVTATPDISLQPPASPNGVIATAGSEKVTLQWNTKLYATSYNIYSIASETITSADLLVSGYVDTVLADADPQPPTQSAEITGLTPGTVYSFVVTAENASGESAAQSSPKRATPTN